ncbi:MAG: hypothetical protein JRN16_03105 [Nitrososphaerota archaeon]|nr:hypothetical protein [Nitrososphaerota archaeon]MDG7018985.1 hypothetical protein [Nitrososphaerota archaeon]MDG7027381.1 hypothetical protein [Nitrososphaerota archaeon]
MPKAVQTSHLKCKKCGVEFDYRWVLGGSLTAIRLWNSRYFRCPSCKKSSIFNVSDTRVDSTIHHCELTVGPG